MASVALSRPEQDGKETLYLPCPDIKITRALQRLDVKDASQCTAVLDTGDICDAVRKVFEEEFKLNEHLDALNRLARCYQGFKADDLEKFHTVFDHAWPQTPEEAAYPAHSGTADRGDDLMVLRIAKTHFGEKVPITFPTEASKVWSEMSALEEFGTYGTIKYIIGEDISGHFAGQITLADLNSESGIQKINQLAELVDAMDDTTQKVFIGVLAAELPASPEGILHAASKVDQYELIAEVSTDRELGEWLVKHGHLGAGISDTVLPYLD